MDFGIAHHLVYLLLGQSAGGSNGDLLLASRSLITGSDIENTVGIYIEGYLNLRDTSRSRGNTLESEVTQALVVAGQFAFALQHMDLDRRLAIFSRAEDLALTYRNSRIALNKPGHHTTQGLNTQGERSDIEQEHIFDITFEDASLDCRTYGYHFIRVDTLVWLFTEELAYHVDYGRHARLPTDQHYLVDISCSDARILKRLQHWTSRVFDQIAYQLL